MPVLIKRYLITVLRYSRVACADLDPGYTGEILFLCAEPGVTPSPATHAILRLLKAGGTI